MASNFKVMQVIPKLGYGGAETGCYDLAHFLAEKDCKSIIVTSGGPLIKYVRRKKVKIIKLPVHLKNPFALIFNALALILLQIIYRIDIVHARSRAPAWSCYWSTFFTRRKFVTTFHGTYNFKNKFKKFYNSVMVKSKLTIAGSNFIFDHINENYKNYLKPKNRLLVIFRGINLHYYDPKNISDIKLLRLKKDWSIQDDKFKILLPGRLTNWKGQINFIEALNILIEDYKNDKFQAIILGSDQGRNVYKKKLQSLIDRYNINKKIIFAEHCKEMPLAYALADIVVSSSIEPEAFGRVAVEAQAMQKPIIATKLGGSMETVLNNKTGILYKFDDPRELAKNINSFMETDKLALNIMGVEGRKNVVKKFDVEKMCQSTFNEYKKLLNL